MRFEFKHLTLHELGVYITFGTRRVVITPETVTIEDYAGHQYVFRKDEGYSIVYGGPQTSLRGRNFDLWIATGTTVLSGLVSDLLQQSRRRWSNVIGR